MAVDFSKFASSPYLVLSNSPALIFSSSRRSNWSNGSSDAVVKFQNRHKMSIGFFKRRAASGISSRNNFLGVARSTGSSSDGNPEDPGASPDKEKVPFGYSRKDVLLIGLGVTLIGIGLKSGLEFVGVDPLQAGNVVQLVLVLGLTVGWISTYMFRVSNKDMTYAQQLRDYEYKVMEKRLEGLTEAELEALLEQVEEEKRQLPRGEKV